MFNHILTIDHLQWLPKWLRPSTNFMKRIPSLTFTELRMVSMEHFQRVWHASRERVSFRTLGSILLFDTFYKCTCDAPTVETSFFPNFQCMFLTLNLEYLWLLSRIFFLTLQTFYEIYDLDIEFDLYQIASGFHGAFATGVLGVVY